MNMLNIKNENSLTAENPSAQTALIHDTGNYSEVLQNCRISKRTANFIACTMALFDLYGKISDALKEMYGEEQTVDILKKIDIDETVDVLESKLYGFVTGSIKENIVVANLTEI